MAHFSSPKKSFVVQEKRLASDRWKILRKAILSSSDKEKLTGVQINPSSKMVFSSFDLFSVTEHIPVKLVRDDASKYTSMSCCNSGDVSDTGKWVRYKASVDTLKSTLSGIIPSYKRVNSSVTVDVVVKYVSKKTSLETLMGFNNTGNVCVWPAEEVMAYYCLKHSDMFQGASVCEVGGGMTSLSGLLLASTGLLSKVLLTDGNQTSVDNIQEIITANECLARINVSAEVIKWDESFFGSPSKYESTFNYVLCADCLFFTNVHSELTQVIYKLLRLHGEALVFAPKRSGTLDQFCRVAHSYFELQIITNYDDIIWHKHKELRKECGYYQEDIHYPILILLRKTFSN